MYVAVVLPLTQGVLDPARQPCHEVVRMSRKFLVALGLAAALLTSPLAQAQQMYVDVTNRTGFTIWHLYVSPSNASDWEEDLLGAAEVMETGATKRITLTGYKSPKFDIKAVDSDGDSYIRMGVNVRNADVVFTLDDLQ